MERVWKIKIARFFLNFLLYASFLTTLAYGLYVSPPELFNLKCVLLPFGSAVFLAVTFSSIFAGVNEIISMLLIKKFRE